MSLKALLAAWVLHLLAIHSLSISGQTSNAVHGAYLGCFNTARLPLDTSKAATFTRKTISKCLPYCYGERYSMHAISQQYQCYCMSQIPNQDARLPDSACDTGGNGIPVFYRLKAANTTMCRIAPVALEPSSFDIHYNEHHVEFSTAEDGEQQMVVMQEGMDGTRLAVKDGFKMYGHYEVTAKIEGTSGVVTAFYVRSTDTYTLSNHDSPFSEIDFEFLNGNPAVPNSIWLNSFRKGMSNGETLLRPADYQKLLHLPANATAGSTWLTYGFSWQPDHVVWYLNGVPILRRKYDEQVTWTEMDGVVKTRSFRPPDAASHVTFSMWTDGNQTRAFGGKLDFSSSPYRSYFKRLRRVLCDQKMPSDLALATAALGPTWLYSSLRTSAVPAGKAAVTPTTRSKAVLPPGGQIPVQDLVSNGSGADQPQPIGAIITESGKRGRGFMANSTEGLASSRLMA